MLAKGRCCHQVEYLSKACDIETFAYLATVGVSKNRLVDHQQCFQYPTCVAYNTDLDTYTTRHTNADCIFSMVSTPYKELTDLISQGKTPLISIEKGTDLNTRPRLRVFSRSKNSEYIAISHVCADGLGNPKENALPLCQVLQYSTI
ncbi:hypothetical protein F5B22DRAFT_582066 [Xylaria bambusicola]|uniref:uncharacterized protein n=1 Tax=Xylaria bambusicola TaxID=326684 RepID=UPI00200724B1|nr:uncharacterized protein F5B22DRAFT_582066 [Xylaria bambusicola]KAI0527725.1 hypothetical protein F5B22DRAFT_582066 [Xylaria bambusicola]